MASTKQVMQGKGSIAVSEEDGRYKMIRYTATDFSLDSLTRDLQDPLQGKSAGRVLKVLGVRDLGIWKSRHLCLTLASAGNTATGEWVALGSSVG